MRRYCSRQYASVALGRVGRRVLAVNRGLLSPRIDLHQRSARADPAAGHDVDAGHVPVDLRLHAHRMAGDQIRDVLAGVALERRADRLDLDGNRRRPRRPSARRCCRGRRRRQRRATRLLQRATSALRRIGQKHPWRPTSEQHVSRAPADKPGPDRIGPWCLAMLGLCGWDQGPARLWKVRRGTGERGH